MFLTLDYPHFDKKYNIVKAGIKTSLNCSAGKRKIKLTADDRKIPFYYHSFGGIPNINPVLSKTVPTNFAGANLTRTHFAGIKDKGRLKGLSESKNLDKAIFD